MTDISIAPADFADPRLAEFLQAHLADMAPTAPAESRHALELSALQHPRVRMWVAFHGDDLVGTVALAELSSDTAELKSMRTDPRLRGRGIASALLHVAINDARQRLIREIYLETGSMDFFAPARALYRKAGFIDCPPFGSYVEDPHSVFLRLAL